jgi:hypothetical protein
MREKDNSNDTIFDKGWMFGAIFGSISTALCAILFHIAFSPPSTVPDGYIYEDEVLYLCEPAPDYIIEKDGVLYNVSIDQVIYELPEDNGKAD